MDIIYKFQMRILINYYKKIKINTINLNTNYNNLMIILILKPIYLYQILNSINYKNKKELKDHQKN